VNLLNRSLFVTNILRITRGIRPIGYLSI